MRMQRLFSYDKCLKCGRTNANARHQSPNDKSDFLARCVNAEQNSGGPTMCLSINRVVTIFTPKFLGLTAGIATDTFCTGTSIQNGVQFSVSFAKTFVLDQDHHSSLVHIVEVSIEPRVHGDAGSGEKSG